MTKDEILAAAGFDNTPEGVAAFYKKFKSKEDFDNYMASGGSSNRVPTAKEFFNFGATTNLNIPFGNFAYGGTNMKDGGPKLSKKKKALVDKAIQDSYNKMVNGKATDQFDELHYDAGLSNDMTRKFMVDTKGPSGASNDPGTYARNINKFLGRDVIPFPVNQSRMMEEDWNNSYQPVAPPIMYYNDDPAMASYPYINYDTLTPPSPQEPEVYAFGGVPCMDCGGYMQDGGFMDMLNSVSKEYKKHITKDTVIQGGNDLNPGQKMTMQFKNKLAQNFQTASIDEIHNEFKQMGGANYSTGPNLTGPAAASTLLAGINTLASGIENSQDKSKQKMAELTLADNTFVKNPLNAQSRGDYDPNSGMLRPDQYVPIQFPGYAQFGGENDLPIAREGLDLRAGLYGTKGNRQFSLPNRVQSTKFSEPLTDVRGTLQPVDRADANVEAEKKEQVVINIDNLPTNFKIGGERHSNGGTPLNLPDDSFIFSDTPKMVIKDPIILAQFGMIPKKSGYTPAEIAKKYDINKFRQVLANKDAEDLEKKTAEMMIANYNMKLAKLALLQESMKGFPQGIPKMAIPYVEANEINPQDLIGGPNQSGPQQMDPNMISTEQGQSDEPDADMGVSRFGGLVKAQDGRAVTKGFGAPLIRKSEGEFAAKYPAIYNAYMTALNNKDVAEMNKVASLIESQQKTQTPWYSLDMIPGSDADMFENLSSVLKEEAAKINGNSSYKPEVIKSKYQDLPVKALGIYGKLKEEYAAIPKDDYMKLIEKDNQIKKIESYLPQNKARFLPESVKEPWQLYNKEDLTMINALFNQTFKQTSGEVKVNKAKVDNTTKPVETKPVETATQAEQQPANIEIKTKPAKAAKPNKTSVDTFYVDDLSAEEKALLGLK